MVARLLERPGAAVLCLSQDDALAAVATQRRRRLAGANAPDAGGRGPARARRRQRALRSWSCKPGLLGVLDLPQEWACGLVLPLPVRGGRPWSAVLVARPEPVSRQVRAALEALATQLALALEGARLD